MPFKPRAATHEHLGWLRSGLTGPPGTVGTLVPPAERVLWVRHPAYRWENGELRRITWSKAVAGATSSPDVQFTDLVGDLNYENGPGPGAGWDVGPLRGTVPPELVDRLARALAAVTDQPWHFGVWAGFSDVESPRRPGELLNDPSRRYLALDGTVEDLGRSLSPLRWQAPNLWWDGPHTWVVHCDIDRTDTFVAGPADLVDQLENALDGFERALVARTDRIYR